ncbi:TetR/AcrR family transcriptional regulator [Haloplasma contractile]|uniref:Pantoate--beta-alanine ligase protein n=1 Tax=Haloplasma contractile SSD-17B TaxID=1033810 RepID=U2DUJ0_9MOLU|nr:TetR/AcrR family transcriptional regulator [Haloplasma contractile]ERJ12067.1 pantoate--beta-alanine ligase protein [Haloplasma contractile SSD-17B]
MNDKNKTFEKKEQLIRAAILEFGNKGYDHASLNSILKEAGISKGTFYYHFKSKEELYIDLVFTLAEKKKQFFNDHLDVNILGKDLFTILEVMIELGLRFASEIPYVTKFSLKFIEDNNSEIYHKIIDKMGIESTTYMDQLIERAYEKGEIKHEFPIEFVKKIITHLFVNIIEIGEINTIEDYKHIAGYLINFIKSGLANEEHKKKIN